MAVGVPATLHALWALKFMGIKSLQARVRRSPQIIAKRLFLVVTV